MKTNSHPPMYSKTQMLDLIISNPVNIYIMLEKINKSYISDDKIKLQLIKNNIIILKNILPDRLYNNKEMLLISTVLYNIKKVLSILSDTNIRLSA